VIGSLEGADINLKHKVAEAVRAACGVVIPVIMRDGADEAPEMIKSLYQMVLKIAKTMPESIVGELRPCLACAVERGLVVQHRDGGRSVTLFIGAMAEWCGDQMSPLSPAARAAVEEGGVATVGAILKAVNGAMPSWSLDPLVEAFRTLNLALGSASFEKLLRGALALNDVPRPDAKEATKETFAVEILAQKAQLDRRVYKRLMKAFCGGKKKNTTGQHCGPPPLNEIR